MSNEAEVQRRLEEDFAVGETVQVEAPQYHGIGTFVEYGPPQRIGVRLQHGHVRYYAPECVSRLGSKPSAQHPQGVNEAMREALAEAYECVRKMLNGDMNPPELNPQGWDAALAKADVQRDGWVSVDDRLPELEQTVDIWLGDRIPSCARIYDASAEGWLWCEMGGPNDGEPLEAIGYCDDGPKDVTHWMPLPDAPEEETR